jgi:hypothetical protein
MLPFNALQGHLLAIFSIYKVEYMIKPSDDQKNIKVSNSIVKPRNCSLTEEGADLLIHRRWGIYAGIKNLAGSVLIAAIMLVFLNALGAQQVFASGIFSKDALAIIFFGGVFLALGIYFLLLGIYQIVNSTTIRVNTTSVSTLHHPLPWRTRAFSANEIKQVFVTPHQRGYLVGSGNMGAKVGQRHHYSVDLLMSGGHKETLVTQVPRLDQAHFIESQIERQLGIEDMRVKGESLL